LNEAMTDALDSQCAKWASDRQLARPLGIFKPWRLCAYGGIIAAAYGLLLLAFYRAGIWLLSSEGVPRYSDFTLPWLVGVQALHGQLAPIYDPVEFLKLQEALVGPRDVFYPNWPYPPTFFFYLVPFALLPYVYAFIAWDVITLLGCAAVVYLIVRRFSAIVLVVASPFTAWVLLAGQNGLLWASLLGASLYFLERRPELAGVFIGLLTFKPQFGLLLPIALVAASVWRAVASAVGTAAILACASVAAFGTDSWAAFPRELMAQANAQLVAVRDNTPIFDWGHTQTIYGLMRTLQSGALLAWLLHIPTAIGVSVIVWLVWRSSVRYPLKAATLSAAALIVTPYGFATDMAAIVIPFAFLAVDQIEYGLLRGEQTIMIMLFGAGLVILVTLGSTPLGPIMMMALLAIILRRARPFERETGAGIRREVPARHLA
jgi:arabinofuranan 3-O-arabinosyltransferase